MSLLKTIKLLCQSNNISLGMLEKEIGLSPASISKWENSSPKAENLQKIADYFEVSVDYLLGREEKEKPTSNDVSFNEFIQALEKLGIKDNLTAQKDLLHKISTLTLEQKNLIFQMIDNFKDKDE